MKQVFFYILIAAMFMLTGCPYNSDTPVDEGSCPVPSWLTGKWQEVKSTGDGSIYLLKPVKTGTGILKAFTDGSDEKKDIILSRAGNSIYMSILEPGDELTEKGYYIFRMTKISDNEMELLPLKEHAAISSAASLKAFLQQHENDADIFEKTELAHYKKQ